MGNGPEYVEAAETRAIGTALVGGCPTAILIGPRIADFDAHAAEIAALQEAVEHGRDQANVDKTCAADWKMLSGIACYDRWATSFDSPDKDRGIGDSYCYGIYRHTHRSAAGFLREISPRHPTMQHRLEAAAAHFIKEADTLDRAEALLGWSAPSGADAERNRKIVPILTEARDHYATGITEIEAALSTKER